MPEFRDQRASLLDGSDAPANSTSPRDHLCLSASLPLRSPPPFFNHLRGVPTLKRQRNALPPRRRNPAEENFTAPLKPFTAPPGASRSPTGEEARRSREEDFPQRASRQWRPAVSQARTGPALHREKMLVSPGRQGNRREEVGHFPSPRRPPLALADPSLSQKPWGKGRQTQKRGRKQAQRRPSEEGAGGVCLPCTQWPPPESGPSLRIEFAIENPIDPPLLRMSGSPR